MGDPTSGYATGGIALRVIGVFKLPYHDKVGATIGENRKSVACICGINFSLRHRNKYLSKHLWTASKI
jgi:hypothetical protein